MAPKSPRLALFVALVAILWARAPAGGQVSLSGSTWETAGGRAVLVPARDGHPSLLVTGSAAPDGADPATSNLLGFGLPENSRIEVISVDDTHGVFGGGRFLLRGDVDLQGSEDRRLRLDGAEVLVHPGAGAGAWSLVVEGEEVLLLLADSLLDLDLENGRLCWDGVEVILTGAGAAALGVPDAAGTILGKLALEAAVRLAGTVTEPREGEEEEESHARGTIGPDVIVGDLPDVRNWGAVGGIRAYSVGTTSCNLGDAPLDWFASTNRHPVIAQNLYRFKDGRFEQIGQSWLKHGFFALSGSLCFTDCEGTDGTRLGVHCSDPYSSSLNGLRSALGPRHEVNASTGEFPYPPTRPVSDETIGRRLQVDEADVDPALNPGARYFVEGHYISPDDAEAGNAFNNASYREVSISGSSFNLTLLGETTRELPAIHAWPLIDPATEEDLFVSDVCDVPDDGRFTIFSRATDQGDGTWHYEYAVHNLNSHRSGGSFSIPTSSGVTVTDPGFHDVAYHSGEPFDGTDWTIDVQPDAISWSTETETQNPSANALRWGTLYNFRFVCDQPPQEGTGTLGLFRAGTPDSVEFDAVVPTVSFDLEDVLAGNVNAGAGPVEDVLFVNGSPGTGPSREINLQTNEAITMNLALPSSVTGSACYVLYAYRGVPTDATITDLPHDLGPFAMPTPFAAGNGTQPLRIANTFGPTAQAKLGTHRWPQPVDKAPTEVLRVESGLKRELDLFFMGLIEDENSLQGRVAVTNGVTVRVRAE